MEFRPHLSMKDITMLTSTALFAVSLPIACVRGPEMRVQVTCSEKPAYGVVNLGPYSHGIITVEGRNLGGIAWLSVGKKGSSLMTVAYGVNNFDKTIDGFARSIRAEGILELNDGQYDLEIGVGSETNRKTILEQIVTVNCPPILLQ